MMSRIQLLKKLLPGFIPLFVFIAADEIWGTKIGLLVAVSVGLVEMGWIGFREKRFDRFILFDTLLLVLLGAVSIILDNDIFFKLKPGLIQLILLAVLGVSAFSSFDIVSLMGKRYLKDVEFNAAQQAQMRKNLKALFILVALHTVLVFYSTFYMSKEAWAFISGGLLYILFGIYFLYELVRQKLKSRRMAGEEWVPLVDEQGKITGSAPRSQVHNGSRLLHPVVHLHVINRNKGLLLQKRPESKLIQPGRWDTAVGGHISAGESLSHALEKEASEEMGLKNFNARLHSVYRWDSEVESELVYLFVTFDWKKYTSHSDEVAEARFWTRNQIEKNLNTGTFTPNFEHEFKILSHSKLL